MRCRRSDGLALLALLVAVEAHATVRHFDLTTEADSNAQGEIELEGWLDFGRPQPLPTPAQANGTSNGMAWMGLRVGLLDNVELASFLVFEKADVPEATGDDRSGLMMWVTELRWRPVEVGKWPVDVFVQGQVMHWFQQFHPTQFRITLGVSKTIGRFTLALNASHWNSLTFFSRKGEFTNWAWFDVTVGASVNLLEADGSIPAINLGVEAWALLPRDGTRPVVIHNHLLEGGGTVLGPTLSLARGRLWLTGHLGLIVHQPDGSGLFLRTPLIGRMMLGINL